MTATTDILIGGATGIGAALAERRLAAGHQILISSRDGRRLADWSQRDGVTTVEADPSTPDGVQAILDAGPDAPAISSIVNCCGSIHLKPAHRTTWDEWRKTVQANLDTAFACVAIGAKHLSKGASIVLVSSVAAQVGLVNHEAIAAVKAGVEGLTRAAAATYATRGLRINAVAPSLVDTPTGAAITGNQAARQASEQMHPLGRIGEPDDVAAVIQTLLDGPWITGQVWTVDGGLGSVRRP